MWGSLKGRDIVELINRTKYEVFDQYDVSLFIFAVFMCRFIEDIWDWNPVKKIGQDPALSIFWEPDATEINIPTCPQSNTSR